MTHDPVACAVASIVFAVVACFALGVRFFVRLGLQNRIFLDDSLSAVATAIYIALSVQYTIGVFRDGVGKHESELNPATYGAGKRTVLICQLLYFVSTYLIKLSFIFTLLRIVTERRYTYTLYVGIASGAVSTILTWFWLLFFCNPISYFWRKQPSPDVQGHCKPLASLTILTMIHGSWILLADLTLGIVIPALLLRKLQMHPRSKLSVLGLLGLGSIASIATIVRMVYLPNLTVHDALNNNNRIIFWSLIEVAINIIATATATWKPLMARWGLFHSSDRQSSTPKNRTRAIPLYDSHWRAWVGQGGRRTEEDEEEDPSTSREEILCTVELSITVDQPTIRDV